MLEFGLFGVPYVSGKDSQKGKYCCLVAMTGLHMTARGDVFFFFSFFCFILTKILSLHIYSKKKKEKSLATIMGKIYMQSGSFLTKDPGPFHLRFFSDTINKRVRNAYVPHKKDLVRNLEKVNYIQL